MKNKILKSITLLLIGMLLAIFGVYSSGAGHGPYPGLSLLIAVIGLIMAIISVIKILFTIEQSISRRNKKTEPSG